MRIFQAIGSFFKILGNKNFAEAVKNIDECEKTSASSDAKSGIQVLMILQRDGRFVDFIMEDIENYNDEQVGAAVRAIHKGCQKALKEYFVLKPIVDQPENSSIKIDKNADVSKINFIGNVSDKLPDAGTLKHHGWEVVEVLLPEISDGKNVNVINPAEIEI